MCFTAVEMEKKRFIVRDFIFQDSYVRVLALIDGGAVKKRSATVRERTNPTTLEPHFTTSATKSRSLEDTNIAVALPHCSESTKEVVDFRIRGEAGVRAELRNVVHQKNGGRGASGRGFVRRIVFFFFFFLGGGRCNTGGVRDEEDYSALS